MAEFLIYNKNHWMDVPSKDSPELTGYENVQQKIMNDSSLSLEKSTLALGLHEITHERRYRRGDIVEARKDGGHRGKREEASFAFLQVPSVSLEDGKAYCATKEDPDYTKARKREHYVYMVGLVLDSHQNATLTDAQFRSRLKVKK